MNLPTSLKTMTICFTVVAIIGTGLFHTREFGLICSERMRRERGDFVSVMRWFSVCIESNGLKMRLIQFMKGLMLLFLISVDRRGQ